MRIMDWRSDVCSSVLALVELTGRGRLPARQIRILPGQSLNEYAKRFFEPHLLDAIPGDLTFAEVISAGKRYRRRDGSWSTMSELVSEAATVWTERVPFAALDAETRRRGAAVLARPGVPVAGEIVTQNVRERSEERLVGEGWVGTC